MNPNAGEPILIIGGGVSGLAAAVGLTQRGHRVVLIEAAPRLGGRLHTLFTAQDGFPIELGPEFVHGEASCTLEYSPHVKKITQNFLYFENAKLQRLGNFAEILDEGFKKIDGNSSDAPMSEIIAKLGSRKAERAFAAFVEGFFAADPKQLSKNSLAGSSGKEFIKNAHVRTGYISLVHNLKRKIELSLYDEHLNQPIQSITWKNGSVRVRSLHGATFQGRAAIITVPIEPFKKIRFKPALKEKSHAAEFIDGGQVIKPVVRFKEPLWSLGREDHQQIVAPGMNFTTRWVWKDAPQFQVTSWVGGAHAEALQNEPFDVLLDLVLQDLSAITGRDPEDLKKLVDGFYYHDWCKDPWAKGAYSFVKVGGGHARKILCESVEDTLFFAGEATATDGSDGTVEGALKSGFRAAKEF